MAKGWNGERQEPTFDAFPESQDAPRRRPPKKRKSKKRPRRSILNRLVYWVLMLGVWGAVGASLVVAYYAAQLPPIDQLAIPKRPPNIAILAEDGTLLANRGDMGGAAVHLAELPSYLPKAFVAIEDRRFYDHWGIDPIGILRALVRDALHRGGMEGGSTLTQQLAKPVPDSGTHTAAQNPGSHPRRLAGAQIFQGSDSRTLFEPRLFRRRCLWRRSGIAEIFRP